MFVRRATLLHEATLGSNEVRNAHTNIACNNEHHCARDKLESNFHQTRRENFEGRKKHSIRPADERILVNSTGESKVLIEREREKEEKGKTRSMH